MPVPVQASLQPAKMLPSEAWATSVTTALLEMRGNARVQLGSQVTPGGVMVTLPVPLPALFKANGRVAVVVLKLAVTLRTLSMLTVQLLVPLQAPLQPAKLLPDAEYAAKVTDVPAG